MKLATTHGEIDLTGPPPVMGILNVTPDSFSDGGRYLDSAAAVARARAMIAEGAALIDVGPESTRPGAKPVPEPEQLARAIPVIAAVRGEFPGTPISIDTRSSRVAEAALDAGADIINDVSAFRDDPAMADLAARRGAPVVLMHMRGSPATMQVNPAYRDVLAEVREFLGARARWAISRGVNPTRILVDPGFGFGKTAEHNLALLRGLGRIAGLGFPVLVGLSRKRLVRHFVGESPGMVLAGSLACALAAALAGATMVRTHDVGPTVEWLSVLAGVNPGRGLHCPGDLAHAPTDACDR